MTLRDAEIDSVVEQKRGHRTDFNPLNVWFRIEFKANQAFYLSWHPFPSEMKQKYKSENTYRRHLRCEDDADTEQTLCDIFFKLLLEKSNIFVNCEYFHCYERTFIRINIVQIDFY